MNFVILNAFLNRINVFFFCIAGSDYRSTTEMITFVPGDSQGATKYVTVQIIGDTVGEPDETFEVSVIPLRPDIDRETIATITIIDNERKVVSITV